jgi:elongation factor Ts
MSQITAAEVSKLRKMTGAGMMDCKKALQETDGNFEKAVEVIRKKGQAVANKRADREATEGVVLARVTEEGNQGALVVLNCETDFVAKNEKFVDFAGSILDVALRENPATVEELKRLKLGARSVEEAVVEQIGVIGEKLDLAHYDFIQAPRVISYIHPGNKLASMVGFNNNHVNEQVAKDVAMQVAAMNPVAVDKDQVPQDVIDQELEIGKEQARREGKPENILDKIAQGKLNKFFKESTLLNQEFIKDNKKTIRQYLGEQDQDLMVTEFKRYSLNA